MKKTKDRSRIGNQTQAVPAITQQTTGETADQKTDEKTSECSEK